MKTIFSTVVVCILVMVSGAQAAAVVRPSTPQEIAEKPELIITAIRNQDAGKSASIVVSSLAAIEASDWSKDKKRENSSALITYAVAAKGVEAAPMMGIVAGSVPVASLPLIAATAVIAAGDNSPAVANALVAAVAENAQAAEACRAACDSPTTVLAPAEVGAIRGITLPTPTEAPAKAPPLPTIIKGAEKYPGQ